MTTDPVRPQEPAGRGRTPRPAATIYDVAKLAGVAPSTVSRALGKPGRITITTRLKVEAAAAELHYRLNPMARSSPRAVPRRWRCSSPTSPIRCSSRWCGAQSAPPPIAGTR
ncbi:hypothetical protein GCM10025867_16030 [Frondihabitans sucicola]|uniref:HTH lacI-type domain-containing protein n=1 Tax=Frondihabitans sucicola TaxID=1268041 RepID=A0ABN6XWG0_9MICO|nr:LacI family DNA-binding transcriptional regulator [Frondihabitans sucicola]BDZ49362.1 hypothetical protein GCM10025867_16030 [Frondihabitans sucicola]